LIYRPKENLKFKFSEKPLINAWGFFLYVPHHLYTTTLLISAEKTIPLLGFLPSIQYELFRFIPPAAAFSTIFIIWIN
jgi:hypothetical protein